MSTEEAQKNNRNNKKVTIQESIKRKSCLPNNKKKTPTPSSHWLWYLAWMWTLTANAFTFIGHYYYDMKYVHIDRWSHIQHIFVY